MVHLELAEKSNGDQLDAGEDENSGDYEERPVLIDDVLMSEDLEGGEED